MLKKKRGQAAGAAVLLAIIAALLIMFILFIPPEDRAALLDDEDTPTTTTDEDFEDVVSEKNLLKEDIGRLDYLAQKEVEHPLPVATIYTKTESKVLAEKQAIFAKRGVFTDESTSIPFFIKDLNLVEEVMLSFKVKKIEGSLEIYLNEEKIYDDAVKVNAIPVIKLPSNLLKEQNKLVFSSSSPGIAFWVTNGLTLENSKVVGDVTSTDAQEAKNIFLISDTEKKNLERAVLRFQPTCKRDEVGKLRITINNKEIYNAIPDCDAPMVPIEFSPNELHKGENQVVFSTLKGIYELSNILVRSELEQVDYPTYYFDLSEEEYNEIKKGDKKVRMKIDFVDISVQKRGDYIFNGHLRYFDTKDISFTEELSEDVVRGNNALKIRPKKTLEIREMNVDLVE